MDVTKWFLLICLSCSCSSETVIQEDIYVKTVIISEEVSSTDGTMFDITSAVHLGKPNLHMGITWLHINNAMEILFTVNSFEETEYDLVIMDTKEQVYESVQTPLAQKHIAVIHWPLSRLLIYGVPQEFMFRQNNCEEQDIEFTCDLNINMTSTRHSHKPLASLLSMSGGKAFVVFEGDTDHGIQFYVPGLDSVNFKFTLYDIDENTTDKKIQFILSEGLNDEKNKDGYIILACSSPCLNRILDSVNQYDRAVNAQTGIEAFSRWIFFSTRENRGRVKTLASNIDNVVFVSPERQNKRESNIFEDFGEVVQTVIYQAQFDPCFTQENITNCLVKYFHLFRLNIEKFYSVHIVETLMWYSHGRDFATVGKLSPFGDMLSHDVFPNTKLGFNGRKFSVATMLWGPFMNKTVADDGKVEYFGFCNDLLNELARTLNFSYTIEEPPDLQWGIEVNGRWTGLVGMLSRREVDMVVAALGMDPKRDEVMDFSYPYFYEYIAALLSKPDPTLRKWRTYLDPFSTTVLLCVIACLPLATFVLFLIEKYNPYYTRSNREEDEGLHVFTDAIWYMYGALLTQGGVHEPSTTSGRTILSFWWLFSIIIVALYSGNLIAFLTVSKQNVPFKTMEDLVEQEEYKWGALNGTLLITLFQNTTTEVYKKVWAGMKRFAETDPDVLSDVLSVHFDKVRSEKYVYISDLTVFQEMMRKECNLMIMEETFFPYHFGVGFQNNSAYLSRVSDRIMELSASGLLTIWKRRWWPNTNPCLQSDTSGKTIDLLDVQSAFYLIGIGIFVATLCLLAELLWSKIKKRGSKRKDTTNESSTTRPSTTNGQL